MTQMTRTLAAGLVLSLAVGAPLGAQPLPAEAPALRASLAAGSIQGTVSDATGHLLEGALVSALGATSSVVTTDATGQFVMHGLPPGSYVLRAHLAGFAASDREMVELRPNGRLVKVFQLRSLGVDPFDAMSTPSVLTAGFAGFPQPMSTDPDAAGADGTDDSHTPTAFRLRHLKRSVLRDANGMPVGYSGENGEFTPADTPTGNWFGWAVESSARLAHSFFTDFPLSGELNLLTAGTYGAPEDVFSGDRLPRGVAFLSLGAPAGSGDWSMRAAMTGVDLSSWILAGSYAASGPSHAYDVGVSYGTQAYKAGNAAPLSDIAEDSRNVGAVYAYDRWKVSRVVELAFGARWSRYDYVDQPNQLSPRLGVSVSPARGTFVRALVSQRMLAPGAEEFLPPPAAGLWLPPERTFSPLASDTFRVERVRTVEIALEREFDDAFIVAVRRFYETTDDQLATLFGVSGPLGVGADVGHYYVATAGSVAADGWGVRFSSPLEYRLRGTVDYSLTRARWTPSLESGIIGGLAPSAARVAAEEIHDVTTSLEANIPETATRVYFVYRLNSGFAGAAGEPLPGFDGRFDLVVNQGLPFRLISSEWEVLVGVRNLFREPTDRGSTYDELLVVRPPTRVIGGFLVRF